MSRPPTTLDRPATTPGTPGGPPPAPRSSGTFAAFEVPGYGRLWVSGLFWNLTRWMSIFVCTYMVNQITGSPLLVQLVGSALFIPMFVGGALGGVLSDRFDRKRSILFQLVMLAPCALLMGLVVLSGHERAWMVYPFILLIGVGQMVDMTVRRAMIFDFVGESRVTNALAIEALSMTGGNMLGGISAGATVSLFGIGETFLIISACYVVAFGVLVGVAMPRREAPVRPRTVSIVADLAEGFRYVRAHRGLVSILGVTALMNLFYFSFIPMVPVFAERLEVGALLAGVLAGSNAFGSMLGTLVIARGMRLGRGAIYVGGSFVALVFMFVFAASGSYPIALVGMMLAGAGTAGFATMQSVLVMVAATPEMRGRAMGILSMAIGALPFSMFFLGLVAEVTGPSVALLGSVVLGVIALGSWTIWRPEATRAL